VIDAGLARWFSRSIGFPLIINSGWRRDKDRHGFDRLLREKLDSQFWPAEQIEAWQVGRLQRLLAHAGQTVPYYRDQFREIGFDPRDVHRLADLGGLPRLTRRTIRAEGARMLAEDAAAAGLTYGQTSGTTGVPLDFWRDRNFDRHLEAAAWMGDMAAGRQFGSPTAYLWGWTPLSSRAQRLLGRLRNGLRNQQQYNTRQMPDEALQRYHRAMQGRPPDILVAYPSGAALLARFLERQGARPRYPRLALITSGEMLETETRATIERVFPAPIFNRYGSREVGLMAFECHEHSGLHVNTANVILESVESEVYEPAGELIVTQLHSYAMPLIRYQVDDLALLASGACGCGRTSPRLARVAGRKMPHFITPAGTPVEPYFLISKVRLMANVVEYQLIQEDRRRLRLLIVPGRGCEPEQFAEARAAIEGLMGPECELRIDFVDHIPRPASGKLQIVVSRLPAEGSTSAGVDS
jgi:phenylacetate-CoA ligase